MTRSRRSSSQRRLHCPTPGRASQARTGGKWAIKIHGRQIPIRCAVAKLDGLSAHADRRGLLGWLESMDGRLTAVIKLTL
ncbi:MAG: MBL fold metallo-hydrolase RNA specificity domain-containing protein [Gemmatimonadota bacterium]